MADNALPVPCEFQGLPALRLSLNDGSSAVVTLFGAQLVSWIPAGSPERLYFSDRAVCDGSQALRGGVPVIFPQFGGDGTLRHGFARRQVWQLAQSRSGADFSTVTLRLESDEASRALWPHHFEMELTVLLSAGRVDLELEVENAGNRNFDFTAALHTYLRVQEVETVTLRGLQDHFYLDQALGSVERQEKAEALLVDREIDRIYQDVHNPLVLTYPRGGALAMVQEGFRDVVVWNPWDTKGPALPDLPKDGFRRFLCVEAAITEPVCLEPGEGWYGRQTLSLL